jgi:branched-chain amino acid transport system substrate-binding protein
VTRSMHPRKAAAALAAGLFAVSLLATACGSDDEPAEASGGSGGGSGDSGGSSELTGEPIKIGYGVSASGPQAAVGLGGQGVAEAWEKYTNDNGGIDGHPVEITVVDTKNTVPGASSAVQGFVKDQDVDAVFLTDLVAEGALGDLFTANPDVAFISAGGSSDLVWTSLPGTFQVVSGSDYVEKAYADAGKAGGGSIYAWAACAEVAICQEGGERSVKYASEEDDMESAGVTLINSANASFTGECLAMMEKDADTIALNLAPPTGARLSTDCITQGFQGKFVVMDSGFDQAVFNEVPGFKSSGSSNGFPWWAEEEAPTAYRDAMAEYAPDAVWQSGNSTAVWASFEMLKKALEDAKPATVDRAAVLAALYQVKDETLGGLLAEPVTFTEGQPSKRVDCSWFFDYNAGDENPSLLPPDGESGNGESGDLASSCSGYLDPSYYS